MARFNTAAHKAKPAVALATSPIATVSKAADTRTFQGAPGWTRTPQAELFLRATGSFHGGEKDFYESAEKRDDRLRELTRQIALEHPTWGFEFARWLRGPGNMRTASLMFAVEYVKARLDAQQHGGVGADVPHPDSADIIATNRRIIDAVCQRPDEPGELLAIWTAWFGRKVPKPVKRGLADAVRRLYNERALLKWDTGTKAYRFGDVLEIVHASPAPDKPWQGALFKHAIDRRHNRAELPPPQLAMVQAHDALMATPVEERRGLVVGQPELLRSAGMTWEALAGWLQGPLDKEVWETMIPSMGIMAQLRNLRNFDQAGVSDKFAQLVIDRLMDPEEIAESKQFPFRFLAAYRATQKAGSLRWAYPLEEALNFSLSNVPALAGRTLILVDRSPSMFPEYDHQYPNTKIKDISRADQAAIFGSALALRAEDATLVEFGGESKKIEVPKGGSILPLVDTFGKINYTDIAAAIKRWYSNHDRVIIITDEQTRAGTVYSSGGFWRGQCEVPIDALVPLDVPVFTWNFAGYSAAAMHSGSGARFSMGGLTDSAFPLISTLENGAAGVWPWQTQGD